MNFGYLCLSLIQVNCHGEGGSAAVGVANPELIKVAIKERHGDKLVDKIEYARLLPVVIKYLEEHEGSRGYQFKTGIEFWAEREGSSACYYASVSKTNTAGVPIRIYSVLLSCQGTVLRYNQVL